MKLAQDKATVGGRAGGPSTGQDTREEPPAADGAHGVPGPETVFRLAEAGFRAAAGSLAGLRDDIVFEDSPAPRRLAPYAAAVEAAVYSGGTDDEIASGRLILLHDPDGQPGWTGVFRLVTLVRAEIEEEMAADPLLGAVGWSWLIDALGLHAPGYTAPSGTVTRVITEGFGAKDDEPARTEFELRASWSPPEDTDLGVNVAAWCDLLAAAAGLPAQPPGTTALRPGKQHPGKQHRGEQHPGRPREPRPGGRNG
jgi:hypothetical protein